MDEQVVVSGEGGRRVRWRRDGGGDGGNEPGTRPETPDPRLQTRDSRPETPDPRLSSRQCTTDTERAGAEDAHVTTPPLWGTRETAHDVPVSAPPLERGARPVKASLGMLAR